MIRTNKWLWCGAGALVIVLGLSLWALAQDSTADTVKKEVTDTAKKEAMDMAQDKAMGDMKMMAGKTCPMGSPAQCMKVCKRNKEQVDEAMKSLDAATAALDSGDTATAKAEVDKAKTLLAAVDKRIGDCLAQAGSCNAKCPISGEAVDPKAPTRTYKGMKVGFCCGACPPVWDKLSDAEKQAKLNKAMPATCPMAPAN
jgi:hypothetical protein